MTEFDSTIKPGSPHTDDSVAGQIARLDEAEARLLASISTEPAAAPSAAAHPTDSPGRRRWLRRNRTA